MDIGILRFKTCDTCSRRNCRKEPNVGGICANKIRAKSGFKFKESSSTQSEEEIRWILNT
jgi:hypothetical protein